MENQQLTNEELRIIREKRKKQIPEWTNSPPPNGFEDVIKRKDSHLICRFNRYRKAWEILWDYGKEKFEGFPDSRYEHIMTCLDPEGKPMLPSDRQLVQLNFLDRANRRAKEFAAIMREQDLKKAADHEKELENEAVAKAKDDAHWFCVKGGFRHRYVKGENLT